MVLIAIPMKILGHGLCDGIGKGAAAQRVIDREDIFSDRMATVTYSQIAADMCYKSILKPRDIFLEKSRLCVDESSQRRLCANLVFSIIIDMTIHCFPKLGNRKLWNSPGEFGGLLSGKLPTLRMQAYTGGSLCLKERMSRLSAHISQ